MALCSRWIGIWAVWLMAVAGLGADDLGARLDALMTAHAERLDFRGAVLVARRGTVLYRRTFGLANREWQVPHTVDSVFRIGSLSKPFTALVVMKLVEEGRLSPDAHLSQYLKGFPRDKGDRITIRQLLTHTAGIAHYPQAPEYEAWMERLPGDADEMIAYWGRMDLLHEPGTRFSYSSFGYNLLAYVCEAVEGKPFGSILEEKIFGPLGMCHTALIDNHRLVPHEATGYEWDPFTGYTRASYLEGSKVIGGGGLISTLDDLLRWDRALREGTLVSSSTLAQIFAPQVPIQDNLSYGLGWMRYHSAVTDEPVVFHAGSTNGFRCELSRHLDSGYLVVVLSNVHVPGAAGFGSLRGDVAAVRRDILRVLLGRPCPLPQRSGACELAGVIIRQGLAAARTRYREMRECTQGVYDWDEGEMNTLGMHLWQKRSLGAEALWVLERNAETCPDSFNVWDSLGWLHDQWQDTPQALDMYRKAIRVYREHPEENRRWERALAQAEAWVKAHEGRRAEP